MVAVTEKVSLSFDLLWAVTAVSLTVNCVVPELDTFRVPYVPAEDPGP